MTAADANLGFRCIDKCREKFFRFSHLAMATTFEILISGHNQKYARQAANDAFTKLNHIENRLSMFIENSDISRINSAEKGQKVIIDIETCKCLCYAVELNRLTQGAFDIAFYAGKGLTSDKLNIDIQSCTAEKLQQGVKVDLGGIGKGWAVDEIIDNLKQWKITNAFVNAGSSTIYGFAPGYDKGWPVKISNPKNNKKLLFHSFLNGLAIAGSGLQFGPHITNPKTTREIDEKFAAWSIAPDATTADALSTAFMVMEPAQIEEFCEKNVDTASMIMLKSETDQNVIMHFGQWPNMEQKL